jgi:hypothetical protein
MRGTAGGWTIQKADFFKSTAHERKGGKDQAASVKASIPTFLFPFFCYIVTS